LFNKAKHLILVLPVCLGVSLGGRAADLVQPDWRGQDGAAYQQWTFSNSANPVAPEIINNSYGAAQAAVTVGSFGSGWLNQLPGLGSMTGYWDVGGSGGKILLDIDNKPHASPKEIWVQVTYFKDITEAPALQVPGAVYLRGQTLIVERVPTGGDWVLEQSVWKIEPSPSHETIVLTSDPKWGSVIDQIVVDTYVRGCVVYFDDLSSFADQWLEQGAGLKADLDEDNDVDFRDYAVFGVLWLKPCPPDWPWP
jgi:hypothetical protein